MVRLGVPVGERVRKSRAVRDLLCPLQGREGARFENSTAPETIDLDLLLSVRSQSLTKELEAGEKPIKPDRTR